MIIVTSMCVYILCVAVWISLHVYFEIILIVLARDAGLTAVWINMHFYFEMILIVMARDAGLTTVWISIHVYFEMILVVWQRTIASPLFII